MLEFGVIVYIARHVLPVSSPPLQDGAVAVDGQLIAAVGRRTEVLAQAGEGAEVRDLGEAILLPGLVNAHAHVELSWLSEARLPEGDYLAWLRSLVELRGHEEPEAARAAAASGIAAMVARGTVAVGDVSNRTWIPGLLSESSLWAVAFHEILGFRHADAERLLAEATAHLDAMEADTRPSAGRVRIALTPHAPHTTSAPLLKALAGRAAAAGSPLSIHVAESETEAAFLRGGAEEFRAFLAERGAWDEHWTPPGQSPVDYLDRLHVLSPRTLAVHCVHLGQRDLSRLQARGVTVVTCPRSNERLGVGTTPVPKLLAAGIPVALGTDSPASAPDLDLFAEMAALRRHHGGIGPLTALRMATVNGASALGLGDRLGSIEPGKLARLVVVPLGDTDDDPLEILISEPETVLHLDAAPWEGAG
jgi:cytosine/adenosine deaminase-related metal-dependent hydrolase